MAAYITVGAKTTHGGEVLSGSPHTTHNGIAVSRKGDKVLCKKCKKMTTILTGDPSFIVDGALLPEKAMLLAAGLPLSLFSNRSASRTLRYLGLSKQRKLDEKLRIMLRK